MTVGAQFKVGVLGIGTDMSEQTVQSLIRLLVKNEQSDEGLHMLFAIPSACFGYIITLRITTPIKF